MSSNIEKIQAEYKHLVCTIQSLEQAINDSQLMLNSQKGIKYGFILFVQSKNNAFLRCDESIKIMSDATHQILALKKERLQVVKAKLAAIEELLSD